MGVVELAEYVCTHLILNFYREGSGLRMTQDSDDPLFVVNIVVWVLVVILAIVALLCSLPRRVVR